MTKTTTFVWDPVSDCVIAELDGNNNVQAVYTNEPQQYGGVLSQRRGSTTSTLHADALGTTRVLTDSTQTTTDTYLYDAWGNQVASTGTTVNPFRWVGRYGYYQDASTGLVYVRARIYRPLVATWMSLWTTQSARFDKLPSYVFATPTSIPNPSASSTQFAWAPASGKHCIIDLVCADLISGVQHCGIEVTDANGTRYYHVVSPGAGVISDDTCDVKDTGPDRINTPTGIGPWRFVQKWTDPTGAMCDCVDKAAANIRSRKLKYHLTPHNYLTDDCANGTPLCNSNYTTHCIMNVCDLKLNGGLDRSTPGWTHRMRSCTNPQYTFLCFGCKCAGQWVLLDKDWCGASGEIRDVPPDELPNPGGDRPVIVS